MAVSQEGARQEGNEGGEAVSGDHMQWWAAVQA